MHKYQLRDERRFTVGLDVELTVYYTGFYSVKGNILNACSVSLLVR